MFSRNRIVPLYLHFLYVYPIRISDVIFHSNFSKFMFKIQFEYHKKDRIVGQANPPSRLKIDYHWKLITTAQGLLGIPSWIKNKGHGC